MTFFRVPRGVMCSAMAGRADAAVWHMDADAVVWHTDTAPGH